MIINDEMVRMWNEAVVAYFMSYSGIFLEGGTQETMNKCQNSRFSDRKLKS